MTNFDEISLFQLRKLLVETIIDAQGRDYALGWLSSAYASYSVHGIDTDREHLIAQICEYRARKEQLLAV
jgi:hypothetical protein